MNLFRIGPVLGKLHHDRPPIHLPPIKPIDGILRLALIVVPHEREPTRISSPAVARDVDVDDIAVAVEEREEVVGRSAEGDVEDEEGEGVAVLRPPGAPEVRHHRRRRCRPGGRRRGRGVMVRGLGVGTG